MAVGDLLKAVVHSAVHGVQCQNAFWYRHRFVSGTPLNAQEELAEGLDVVFTTPLKNVMSEDALFTMIEVWNYTDGVGYASINLPGDVGQIASEGAPSQWAVGLKMGRPGIGWNYPRKRISGFPLFSFTGNDVDPALDSVVMGVGNDCRLVNRFGEGFEWVVIRPAANFGLGNAVVLGEGIVGEAISIYDASQMSRRN